MPLWAAMRSKREVPRVAVQWHGRATRRLTRNEASRSVA